MMDRRERSSTVINAQPRTFTEEESPPVGERIELLTESGYPLTWTGKRWHWGRGTVDLQLHDAWPPDAPGPYFEVPNGPIVTEHAVEMTGGGMHVRAEGLERVYPLDQWVADRQRQGARVRRRRVIVIEDWTEVEGRS